VTSLVLTAAGAYVAFAIGANNAANSAAFLVSGGALEPELAPYLAGVGMALGSLLLGGRVLDTVGARITTLCQIRAILIAAVTGTLILVASLFGAPVSLNQTVTAAVIGLGFATDGSCVVYQNPAVRRIVTAWALSPVLSAGLAFGLVPLMV
jgi:sulfate permease